jgi:hypothetical protein
MSLSLASNACAAFSGLAARLTVPVTLMGLALKIQAKSLLAHIYTLI